MDESLTVDTEAGEDAPELFVETPVPTEVVVLSNDTWGRLALRCGVDADDLARANGMTCRSLLHARQRLRLPL
jgi:hypothetical protein